MPPSRTSPLAAIEPRLRLLLPADLYATAWMDSSAATLVRVFEHLRVLQRVLHDYLPRQVVEVPPRPGEIRYEWQEGTLMFTDLAGFTRLVEVNARYGREGAQMLLGLLNAYFAEMIAIASKSGGNLLEFTGDALLVQFPADERQRDTAQAVRAGLRMQRAMARFSKIETAHGTFSLGMRVGIHIGRYLTADVGTPRRMDHVLLGRTVQHAKDAEGRGEVGKVCLTESAYQRVQDAFRCESGNSGYRLVVDDFTEDQLGEYDIAPPRRRAASMLLLDRSVDGLVTTIEEAVERLEPLASYLPLPVLNLLVESAASRQITPEFPRPTVVFVNLIGLPESVDRAVPDEVHSLVIGFSRAFALINAAVEARGGILKKVTYHPAGSDIVIYFGALNAHTDDSMRAADTTLAIRDIIAHLTPPTVGGKQVTVACQIGMCCGPTFAAEIGEPRGRREFNVSGDTVNTAARLMGHASQHQILMTEAVYREIAPRFACESLGSIPLKGKAAPVPIFALHNRLEDEH